MRFGSFTADEFGTVSTYPRPDLTLTFSTLSIKPGNGLPYDIVTKRENFELRWVSKYVVSARFRRHGSSALMTEASRDMHFVLTRLRLLLAATFAFKTVENLQPLCPHLVRHSGACLLRNSPFSPFPPVGAVNTR